MNATQGSQVSTATETNRWGFAPFQGAFHVLVTTEDGQFEVDRVHGSREDAEELAGMVDECLAHWASNGMTHVNADTVEAAWAAARGARTFARMTGR